MTMREEQAFELYVKNNPQFVQIVNLNLEGFIPTSSPKSIPEAFKLLEAESKVSKQVEKSLIATFENSTSAPKKGIANLLSRFGIRAGVKKPAEPQEEERNKPTPGGK
jgi:hypothetical protein